MRFSIKAALGAVGLSILPAVAAAQQDVVYRSALCGGVGPCFTATFGGGALPGSSDFLRVAADFAGTDGVLTAFLTGGGRFADLDGNCVMPTMIRGQNCTAFPEFSTFSSVPSVSALTLGVGYGRGSDGISVLRSESIVLSRATAVPEPATVALLGGGLLVLGGIGAVCRRQAAY